MKSKICGSCGKWRKIVHFHANKRQHAVWCKSCRRLYLLRSRHGLHQGTHIWQLEQQRKVDELIRLQHKVAKLYSNLSHNYIAQGDDILAEGKEIIGLA